MKLDPATIAELQKRGAVVGPAVKIPGAEPEPKRAKYGNRKVMVDGILFDSKRELKRWVLLKCLEKAGRIAYLERQVTFDLIVNGVLVTKYRADFVYKEQPPDSDLFSVKVVEDSKGYADRRWPMVKKLMLACHGIKVWEV